MKALATIKDMPDTRQQVEHFVSLAIDEALSGHTDLLRLYIKLYAAQEAISGIISGIKSYVLEEAGKYAARGEFTVGGATYSISQRTTYEYKDCNWSKYRDAVKTVKECEKLLKSLRHSIVDEGTGEVIDPLAVKVTEIISVKKY